MGVGPFAFRYQGNGATPCQYIDTTRKAIDCATTLPLTFLCKETLQQTSCPLLSKLSQRRQIEVFDLHFEEVRGGVESWLTAGWKALVRLPIHHNWTFFASSYCWYATRQTCQILLLSGEGGSLCAKISGGRGRPWWVFFGFYKTRHIVLSDSANCTMLRTVVLTQYRHVTNGQTDRRNCCS